MKSQTLLDGTAGKKGGNSGYWAPSNAEEDDKQQGIRDKKFEGYSNLKGSHDMQQKKTQRQTVSFKPVNLNPGPDVG